MQIDCCHTTAEMNFTSIAFSYYAIVVKLIMQRYFRMTETIVWSIGKNKTLANHLADRYNLESKGHYQNMRKVLP